MFQYYIMKKNISIIRINNISRGGADNAPQGGEETTPGGQEENQAGNLSEQQGQEENQAGEETTPGGQEENQAGNLSEQQGQEENQAGEETTPGGQDEKPAGEGESLKVDRDLVNFFKEINNISNMVSAEKNKLKEFIKKADEQEIYLLESVGDISLDKEGTDIKINGDKYKMYNDVKVDQQIMEKLNKLDNDNQDVKLNKLQAKEGFKPVISIGGKKTKRKLLKQKRSIKKKGKNKRKMSLNKLKKKKTRFSIRRN